MLTFRKASLVRPGTGQNLAGRGFGMQGPLLR